jgi:hypothetical protein
MEERRAAIDRRFDDSLGSFDAQLRNEQERIAREHDARQAGGDAGHTDDAAATGEQSSAARPANSGETATEGSDQDAAPSGGRHGRAEGKSSHAGDLKSEKSTNVGATSNDNSGNGATAREIPDGSDDDVVARRLRRAAEQETDPELKDKLWKEYIDYKNNAGK